VTTAVALVVLLAAVVLGITSSLVPVIRDLPPAGTLVEGAVLLAVVWLAQGWALRTVSYVRWIRPAYR
jgi:hypothetical protein